MCSRRGPFSAIIFTMMLAMVMVQPFMHSEPFATSDGLVTSPTIEGRAIVNWTQPDPPRSAGGFAPTTWQPGDSSAPWSVSWSPNGELIAAAFSSGRLMVWNDTDGRVVFYAPHNDMLVAIEWLDETNLLAIDSNDGWHSWNISDNGGPRPEREARYHTGHWTSGMNGQNDGWAWGLTVNNDKNLVAFCGSRVGGGGELVVANAAHFIDGSPHSARSRLTADWLADCSFNQTGDGITAIARHSGGDMVHHYSTNDFSSPLWSRNIGPGAIGDVVRWNPTEERYTVGWNRDSEGVVTEFLADDGSVEWFTTLDQNVSTLEWTLGGDMLVVGTADIGRIETYDSSGIHHHTYGWQGWSGGGRATLREASFSFDSNQLAVAGVDGSIEVWQVDSANQNLTTPHRHSTGLMREAEVHPTLPFLALAEAGGIASIRNIELGTVVTRCMHPSYGDDRIDVPYTKSVVWYQNQENQTRLVAGFSDGVVIGCGLNGINEWVYNISTTEPFSVFGRVEVDGESNLMAVSWAAQSGSDGRVAILNLDGLTKVKEWNYAQIHWALEWNHNHTLLASSSQLGEVRIWDTSDPNPANWNDLGIQYQHSQYCGALAWHPKSNLLLTVGWDKRAIVWNHSSQQALLDIEVRGEGFGALFLDDWGEIIVASGDATTSASGFIERYSLDDGQIKGYHPIVNIPRGIGKVPENTALVVANHTGGWMVLKPDQDQDGVIDTEDFLPSDPSQWSDSDSDGFGDNRWGFEGDGCPFEVGNSTEDRFGCLDSDGDGWSDPSEEWLSHPLGEGDAFPIDSEQWRDSDGDGWGDEYNFTLAENGWEKLHETGDAFPFDSTQWKDGDSDGWGDNYSWDIDVNGLRANQSGDAFVNDPEQWSDLDGDGCGDEYRWLLDDDTGLRLHLSGDAVIDDSTNCQDMDGDGYGDNYSYEVNNNGWRRFNQTGDCFPTDENQWLDTDGDGYGDRYGHDLDSETHLRINEWGDAFPLNPSQYRDKDGDMHGDNYSFDINANGLRENETGDAFLDDRLAWHDRDGDGCPLDSATGLDIDFYPENPLHCLEGHPPSLPDGFSIVVERLDEWVVEISWLTLSTEVHSITLKGVVHENGTTCDEACMITVSNALNEVDFHPAGEAHNLIFQPLADDDILTIYVEVMSDEGFALELWYNFTNQTKPPVTDNGGEDDNQEPSEHETGGDSKPPSLTLLILASASLLILVAGAVFLLKGSKEGDDDRMLTDFSVPIENPLIEEPAIFGIEPPPALGIEQTSTFGTAEPPALGIEQTSTFGTAEPPALGIEQTSTFGTAEPPALGQTQSLCKGCGASQIVKEHDKHRYYWCPTCQVWGDYIDTV